LRRLEEWKSQYQPILGTLTAALEPLTEDELENFTNIKPRQLRQELGVIRQFLDEARNEAGKITYAIFHQSLRDYLLNKDRNQHYWCDTKEQHTLIIDYYKNRTKMWQQLSQVNRYGVRHLAQHLVVAERVKELHTLLAVETSDRQNAWSVLKDQIGDTTGFLADIALAWDQAEQEFETTGRGLALGLQFRYSLITASFNSFASKFPVPILIALVKRKFWSIDEAVPYVEKIVNTYDQVEAIVRLSAYLPGFLNDKSNQILKEGVDQLLGLRNYKNLEKQVLNADVYRRTDNLREKYVLKPLEHFTNLRFDIFSLPKSVQQAINEQISNYLKRAIWCKAEYSVSYVQYLVNLASYALYMSNPTQELELIKNEFSMRLEGEKNKAKTLLEREPVSYTSWIDDYEYESVWDYPEMGRKELEKLDELQEKFMNIISSKIEQTEVESLTSESFVQGDFLIDSDLQLAEALSSLGSNNKSAEKLAELIYRSSDKIINSTVYEVLKIIRLINDENSQRSMLLALIPYVKRTLREQIFFKEFKATSSIHGLEPYLDQFQDGKVWEEVFKDCKKELKSGQASAPDKTMEIFMKLKEIFPYLAQPFKIKGCQLIYNSNLPTEEKMEILKEFLLLSSGETKHECLTKINLLKQEQRQQKLKEQLRELDPSFPELFEKQETQQILDSVRSIESTFNQLLLIAKLLPYLAKVSQEEIIQEILEAVGIMSKIESISNTNPNEEQLSNPTGISLEATGIPGIFRKLFKFSLSDSQETEKFQEFIPLIEDEYERWLILKELIIALPESLQALILPEFLSYEKANANRHNRRRRFYRVMDLIEVGYNLPDRSKKKIFDKALKLILKPTTNNRQEYTLLQLIPYLPNSLMKKAANAAFTIKSEKAIKNLLSDLSKSQIKEILQDIFLLENNDERIYRLGFLLPYLPNSLKEEVVSQAVNLEKEILQDIFLLENSDERIYRLGFLLPYLPNSLKEEVVSQAVNLAQSPNSSESREKLLELLPYLPESLIYQVAKQVIDSIVYVTKKSLLTNSLIDSLRALAPYLPKTLISKALHIACSIQDEEIRAEVLAALTVCVIDPLTESYPHWKNSLRTLSQQNRQHCLSFMCPLAPIIKSLGGKEAAEEAAYAVQDVGRWYP